MYSDDTTTGSSRHVLGVSFCSLHSDQEGYQLKQWHSRTNTSTVTLGFVIGLPLPIHGMET